MGIDQNSSWNCRVATERSLPLFSCVTFDRVVYFLYFLGTSVWFLHCTALNPTLKRSMFKKHSYHCFESIPPTLINEQLVQTLHRSIFRSTTDSRSQLVPTRLKFLFWCATDLEFVVHSSSIQNSLLEELRFPNVICCSPLSLADRTHLKYQETE